MVTLDQIKELRSLTGVSTMVCKNALEECSGDLRKAIEWLRKKGETKAAARSDRSTGEGGIFVKATPGKASLVCVKCETDFVARSDDFLQYGQELAEAEYQGSFDATAARLTEISSKVGEKLEICQHTSLEGPMVGFYVHTNRKIGVLVSVSKGDEQLAKDVAMHIAALNPHFLSPEEVDATLVASERAIWMEQLKKEGKPEAIIEKILQGKEKKFREEQALITQPFVKDPEKTVGAYGGNAKIQKFMRFVV